MGDRNPCVSGTKTPLKSSQKKLSSWTDLQNRGRILEAFSEMGIRLKRRSDYYQNAKS